MDNYTLNLKISSITCGACIKLIKKKVGKLDGVKDVIIKDYSGETTIVSVKPLKISDIIGTLSGTPYQVSAE